MNHCRDWGFSHSGLEAGLPAFQLPMFANCDALPKRDLFYLLVSGNHSWNSFGEFQSSTPCQKQVPESRSTLYQLCIMVASVAWCLQKIELWYPRFGLQDFDCDLGCLIYATAASQWRIVEIQLLASVVSLSAADVLIMWLTGDRILVGHVCFQESIPAIPFGNFNHPLPARSRFLRAAARSTTFALWLHHAHPFVAVAWKTCLIEIL